jgi:ferredoxin
MSVNRRDSRARQVLDLGIRIVEGVERSICGRHVVASPAAAEGLALAGARSAAISFGVDLSGAASNSGSAYVVHSDRFAKAPGPGSVVLVAGSHQAAADQCLVAHALSAALRCRVDALVDPRVANGLGRACPPSLEQVAGALDHDGVRLADASPVEPVEPVISQCFTRVQSILGRSCGPVRFRGATPKVTLLTAGFPEGLLPPVPSSGSPRVGHLALDMLRPLPVAALGAATAPGKPLIVLIPEKSPLHLEVLHGLTEAAAAGQLSPSRVLGLVVDEGIHSPGALIDFLRERVPSDLGKLFGAESAASPEEEVAFRIGAAPGGVRAESLLLYCAATLASDPHSPNDFRLVHRGQELVSLDIGRPDEGVDLLLLRPSRRVNLGPAARALRPEGGVLLQAEAREEPPATWARLSQAARGELLERKVRVWWIEASGENRLEARLAAAMGHCLGALRDRPFDPGWSDSETPAQSPPRELDATTLEAALESPPASPIELPRISGESDNFTGPEDWTALIREFHLTGHKPAGADSDVSLLPAGAIEEAEEKTWHRSLPLFLPDPAEGGDPEPLLSMLESLCRDMGEGSVLKRLLPHLVELAERAARSDGRAAAVFAVALERLAEAVDLSVAGRRRLGEEIGELRTRLPAKGEVVPFAPSGWWRLYRWSMGRGLGTRRTAFAGEIEGLANELEAILTVDRGLLPQSRSSQSLKSSLGEGGSALVDPERLAASVPRRKGSTPLDDERRSRIEQTLAHLRSFLDRWRGWPEAYRVHAGSLKPAEGEAGTTSILHPAPFELALGLFSGFADELVEASRAIRVARLDASGEFDPERHRPIIDRLSWESLMLEELAILPRITVFESARRLSTVSLTDLHRLLSSGRPIQVFVGLDDIPPSGEELSGLPPDMAYLGMAHREVFILQSGLGDWPHLLEGFQHMLEIPGPAVALMSLPAEESSPQESWLRWLTLRDSRSVPLCRYDPGKGVSWAERFSLEGNPQPDRPAMVRVIRYLDEEGVEATAEEICTFAHAAALDPHFLPSFLVIPPTAWSSEQVPVSHYLAEYTDLPPETIPFIWVLDGRGALRRAVMTREMAHVCRLRGRAWKVLQELAGLNNLHVERAVENARREVLADAEAKIRDSLETARAEGAREAVDRLVALLADPAASIPPPTRAAEAPTAEAAAPTPVEEPRTPDREEVEEEDLTTLDDPYIDSFLCTSCNDCINLNPLMFKYNHDRQAFIADAAAGTYRDLVKAAEICPAHCIHPGAPRPGDETATTEVMERAKALR